MSVSFDSRIICSSDLRIKIKCKINIWRLRCAAYCFDLWCIGLFSPFLFRVIRWRKAVMKDMTDNCGYYGHNLVYKLSIFTGRIIRLRITLSKYHMNQLLNLSHFLSFLSTNQTVKTWKRDQPTHDEKWKRDEAADSYGNYCRALLLFSAWHFWLYIRWPCLYKLKFIFQNLHF